VNTIQIYMGPDIHKDKTTNRFAWTCERFSLWPHKKKAKGP